MRRSTNGLVDNTLAVSVLRHFDGFCWVMEFKIRIDICLIILLTEHRWLHQFISKSPLQTAPMFTSTSTLQPHSRHILSICRDIMMVI